MKSGVQLFYDMAAAENLMGFAYITRDTSSFSTAVENYIHARWGIKTQVDRSVSEELMNIFLDNEAEFWKGVEAIANPPSERSQHDTIILTTPMG